MYLVCVSLKIPNCKIKINKFSQVKLILWPNQERKTMHIHLLLSRQSDYDWLTSGQCAQRAILSKYLYLSLNGHL